MPVSNLACMLCHFLVYNNIARSTIIKFNTHSILGLDYHVQSCNAVTHTMKDTMDKFKPVYKGQTFRSQMLLL